MNNNISNFTKKQEYSDGKYSVYSFSGDNHKFRRLSCTQDSICVLPFDLNEHQQVNNIYLSKFIDHLDGGTSLTCITKTFDKDQFDSYFDSVQNCLHDEMGLNDVNIDDCYFLGKIKHNLPFSKEFRCYGVNLSNYADQPSGYSINRLKPNPNIHSIEKVKFNRLVKGDVPDSLALSCALLLLSYFTE